MPKDGYIKFICEVEDKKAVEFSGLSELNKHRKRLMEAGLIGMFDNGIGFGNISIRQSEKPTFVITGSATGGHKTLRKTHLALVTSFAFDRNELTCRGATKASSESLSHAAVYMACPEANAVVHVHDEELWKAMFGNLPTTPQTAFYGTPELAYEIIKLFKETDVKKHGVFVMGGHEYGLISFGKTLAEATKRILELKERL